MPRSMTIQEAKEFLEKELPKIKEETERMKAIAEAFEAMGGLQQDHGLLFGPQTELEFRRMLEELKEAAKDDK